MSNCKCTHLDSSCYSKDPSPCDTHSTNYTWSSPYTELYILFQPWTKSNMSSIDKRTKFDSLRSIVKIVFDHNRRLLSMHHRTNPMWHTWFHSSIVDMDTCMLSLSMSYLCRWRIDWMRCNLLHRRRFFWL